MGNAPGGLTALNTSSVPRARILQVAKQYGTHWAVRNLNLDLQPGELFAFLGPNGAGKTTTIKLLCGLLRPSSGTIEVGGHNLATHGLEARRLMSYVPDLPYVYEHLTAREFLQLAADLHGLDNDTAQKRIAEVIELFELERFIDQLTERFSHGMRQRTVFASAMLPHPQLLIVDEPTVGLDPRVSTPGREIPFSYPLTRLMWSNKLQTVLASSWVANLLAAAALKTFVPRQL